MHVRIVIYIYLILLNEIYPFTSLRAIIKSEDFPNMEGDKFFYQNNDFELNSESQSTGLCNTYIDFNFANCVDRLIDTFFLIIVFMCKSYRDFLYLLQYNLCLKKIMVYPSLYIVQVFFTAERKPLFCMFIFVLQLFIS